MRFLCLPLFSSSPLLDSTFCADGPWLIFSLHTGPQGFLSVSACWVVVARLRTASRSQRSFDLAGKRFGRVSISFPGFALLLATWLQGRDGSVTGAVMSAVPVGFTHRKLPLATLSVTVFYLSPNCLCSIVCDLCLVCVVQIMLVSLSILLNSLSFFSLSLSISLFCK